MARSKKIKFIVSDKNWRNNLAIKMSEYFCRSITKDFFLSKKKITNGEEIFVKYVSLFALTVICSLLVKFSSGQSLENIRLHVENVNDFARGYNQARHEYDGDFVRNFITNPSTRPILASVLKSIPLRQISMESTRDGHRCQSTKWRLISKRAVAFVYTVKGKHPLIPRDKVYDKVRKDLKKYSHTNGVHCVGILPNGMKPISNTECEAILNIPLPASQEVSNARTSYTVQFDVLDANNNIILTRSEKISIAAYVPLIVSVGESLASGEGNPDIPGASEADEYSFTQQDCDDDATVMFALDIDPIMLKRPYWLDRNDHRSLRSSHAIAARDLLTDWPYVNFLSFAKSGSKIVSLEQDYNIIRQLQHVRSLLGDHKIDVLLISAGGNDVGFAEILENMAKDPLDKNRENAMDFFRKRLPTLHDPIVGYPRIASIIQQLNLNIGIVLINEYSGHLFNKGNGRPGDGCGVFDSGKFFKISSADAFVLDSMGILLNGEIRANASALGWRLVTGISDQFLTHGYCSSVPYYKGASESCTTQGDFMGTMHPNERGTRVYARAIARELRRVLPRAPGIVGPVTR
jgi:hypothetical protein